MSYIQKVAKTMASLDIKEMIWDFGYLTNVQDGLLLLLRAGCRHDLKFCWDIGEYQFTLSVQDLDLIEDGFFRKTSDFRLQLVRLCKAACK